MSLLLNVLSPVEKWPWEGKVALVDKAEEEHSPPEEENMKSKGFYIVRSSHLLWWVAPSLRETSLLLLGWIDKPTRLGLGMETD